jgi:hypothetical protein
MKRLSPQASCWLTLVVATFSVSATAEPVVRTVPVAGPTIIAFVPSEVRDQKDEGSIEGVAHVQFAMQDTAKCLGTKQVKFEFEFADTIVLKSGNQSTTIQVGSLGQGFGAVLAEPGRQAKVVFTEIGPSTLLYLLPRAAAEYWHVEACKTDG